MDQLINLSAGLERISVWDVVAAAWPTVPIVAAIYVVFFILIIYAGDGDKC